MRIYDEYFYYHEKYQRKFGNDTIILMQVGHFYEIYAIGDKGYDLNKLSDILDSQLTMKDKSKPEGPTNPHLIGFPTLSLSRKIGKLVYQNGITVVIIDEVTHGPDCKREVTKICSPGTNIDDLDIPDSNYMMAIYFKEEPQFGNCVVNCCGLSLIDLSTGENYIHEAYSVNGDDTLPLDEAQRFIKSYQPSEIVMFIERTKELDEDVKLHGRLSIDKIRLYLELDCRQCNIRNVVDKKFHKLTYQNEFLGRVFPNTGLLTPIQSLDLEAKPYALVSYLLLLDFAYQHNEKIIGNIHPPELLTSNHYLVLGNDAVHQLDIVDSGKSTFRSRYQSLFDIVNMTSTAIGKRRLRTQLINPMVSVKKLENRYRSIQCIIDNVLVDNIEQCLKKTIDFERLQRRILIHTLHPYEFVDLVESYQQLIKLTQLVSEYPDLAFFKPVNKVLEELEQFIKDANAIFDYDLMRKSTLADFGDSFFIKGTYPEIDTDQKRIDDISNFMMGVCQTFSGYIS